MSDEDLLQSGPVLLFDGSCGVCARSIQWVLAHEREHHLRFAALESPLGQRLRDRAGVPAEVDSLIWIDASAGATPTGLVYSEAVRQVLGYVGGPWRILHVLLGLVPRPVRDLGYRIFARHRRAVVAERCLVPTPDERRRFVDGTFGAPSPQP